MASQEPKQETLKKDENVGLLFGYHKDMYRERQGKPSFAKQCYAIYCARGSITSWTISFAIGIIIMGILCTLYGYFLPSMYFSLTSDVSANMTINGEKNYEKEARSLRDIYRGRDIYIIAGLVVLFLGGMMMSLSLLLPLCIGSGVDRIPTSSHITVRNELGTATARRGENYLNSYTEETYH